MTKYKCVRACIWRGKYFSEGEIYESSDSKVRPPYHFEAIDKSEGVTANKPVKAKDAKDAKESEVVVKNE